MAWVKTAPHGVNGEYYTPTDSEIISTVNPYTLYFDEDYYISHGTCFSAWFRPIE